ncbi:MAG: DUF1963 domain-containing protein [Candidatus Obscuribacterales bacterium]|nr:DUF1963 domain-containing protein [Candidatus Obscuribacterales bacterium]
MKRAYSIAFKPSPGPCREPVTKFGGQPVFIQEPQWPLSASTGEQMKFICQIQLYPELFGQVSGRMAYIFMTDLEKQVVPAWDPDAGENAVIIQPGRPVRVKTIAATAGPTIYEYVEVPGDDMLHPRSCEFLVDVFRRSDPDFVDEAHRVAMEDPIFEKYSKEVEGNKFGGTPAFLQEDALPPSGHLLLQLDSTKVPFYINFGDCGIGYAFISPDGSMGKFLFQSY